MTYATLFMRLALGISFLSAVADRFGLWGAYGKPHIAWGNFSRFAAYSGTLLWFLPQTLYPLVAWTATAAEIVFGLALILGLFTRAVAFLSGILLLTFALAMTFSLGIKAPLDFSVFSASAGGWGGARGQRERQCFARRKGEGPAVYVSPPLTKIFGQTVTIIVVAQG